MLPESITVESDRKPSHNRFNIRIKQGDKVLLAGRVNPYKPDEIENIVTRAKEQLPGLNGQCEQIREHLLNLASGPTNRKPAATSEDGKPTILIKEDEHRVIAETIEAMKADEKIFHRGNLLVHVLTEGGESNGIKRCDGSKTIAIVPAPYLRERITTVASFTREAGQDGQVIPSHPTSWLVSPTFAPTSKFANFSN